jgi:predicted alpha/beta superfamily hydrolase
MIDRQTGLRSPLFSIEKPRTFRLAGYPFPHEVRVALPLSYRESDRTYPVLWVTDNALESTLAVVGRREIVIAAIGGRPEDPVAMPESGRAYDFFPEPNFLPPGPSGDDIAADIEASGSTARGGGAEAFRDFLIDEIRPALAVDYRIDPHDQALAGGSGGGWFTVYVMLTRPEAFAKYIAYAPALNFCQGLIWRVEEEYAARHDDLRAEIFMACGDAEMVDTPRIECFSSMAKMIERLSFRAFPSLRLHYQLLLGETHESGGPAALSAGFRKLWPARS